MKKKNNFKRLAILSGLTLVTVFVWISLDSYHQLIKKEYSEKVSSLIEPLDPKLKKDVLDKILLRKEYSLNEVGFSTSQSFLNLEGGSSEEKINVQE